MNPFRIHDSSRLFGVMTTLLMAVSMAFSPSSGLAANRVAYIPNVGSDNVTVVDTFTQGVITTLAVNYSYSSAVNPDSSRHEAYISSWDDIVVPVDTQTQTLGSPIALDSGSQPVGITFTADGQTAYVLGSGNDSVYVIDVASRTVASYPTTGCGFPTASVLHGSTLILTCLTSGNVGFFDTSTHVITTVAVGIGPSNLALSTATDKVYVANDFDSSVSVIDISNPGGPSVVSTITTGTAPFNSPSGIAVSADGTKLYVANFADNKLLVLDHLSTTPQLAATLTLGSTGIAGLGLSADKSTLYAPHVGDGEGISIVSTGTDTETATIATPTGNAPFIAYGNFLGTVTAAPTPTFTIGGTVTGLRNGGSVVLRNNGADDLTVSANGFFTFATGVAGGNPYDVTVAIQSAGQTCAVSNGSGTVASANVASVAVNCTDNPILTYLVGGTISGLANGTSVVLQNNGADDLTVTGNGGFTFATGLAGGVVYTVSVRTQPPGQTCTVANGSGTVASANVAGVAVNCTDNPILTYSVGGTISGLANGTSVVLQNNGADDLTVTGNGGFTFAVGLAGGAPYTVSVRTQPPGQTCTIANGSGSVVSANVTTVVVACVSDAVAINGQCGPANDTVYSSAPAATDLCAAGTSGALALLGDGRYQWSCAGSGGGTTVTCNTLAPAGKLNQTALVINTEFKHVRAGRGIILKVKGGSGTGKLKLTVKANGHARCTLYRLGRKAFLKTGGRFGACTVNATKAGNDTFNATTASPVAITVD